MQSGTYMIKLMKIHRSVIVLLTFILCLGVKSQEVNPELNPKQLAAKQIEQIKKGSVTFVLPSELKKLNELYRLSRSEDLSERQRRKFESRYHSQLQERIEFNHDLMNAVNAFFTFTKSQFIYDYQLRSEPPEENFAEAPPFEYVDLPGPEYRLRIGKTKAVENFGIRALILTDSTGKDLASPFPYYVRRNRYFWQQANFFLDLKKDPYELIEELNEQLSSFYIEAMTRPDYR